MEKSQRSDNRYRKISSRSYVLAYVLAYVLGDTGATRQISHEGMEKMEVTCAAVAFQIVSGVSATRVEIKGGPGLE